MPAAVQLAGLDVDLNREEPWQPRHLRLLGGGRAGREEARLVAISPGRKLWELADDAGKVADVVVVPVSFPPAELAHGTFNCGMFTPGEAVDSPGRRS